MTKVSGCTSDGVCSRESPRRGSRGFRLAVDAISVVALIGAAWLLHPPADAAPSSRVADGGRASLADAVHVSAAADNYVARRAYGAAEPLYWQALRVFEEIVGPASIQIAGPLHNLARLYRSWGRLDEADAVYRREAKLFEKELGARNLPLGLVLADMADIASLQERSGDAEKLYRRALAMVEEALGTETPRATTVRERYAALLARQHRSTEGLTPWILLPALGALAAVYVVLPVALDAFSRYRRRKEVRCPVSGGQAQVQIDPRSAAFSAVLGRRSLRITGCSLWPERLDCRRACLALQSGRSSV